MGGGEADRPSRPAGAWSAAGIDRRTFIRRAGQTGVAAGALAWSTPRIRSVGTQAVAGSPAPASTTTPPAVAGGPLTPTAPGSSEPIVEGVQQDRSRGGLAITGAELGEIAALGAAAVGTGELLRRKGLHRKHALEDDAARYADAPPAGDSPDPA